jgi:hypothetical protein
MLSVDEGILQAQEMVIVVLIEFCVELQRISSEQENRG